MVSARFSPFLTEAIPYVDRRHEVLQNWTLIQQVIGAGHRALPEDQRQLEFPVRQQDQESVSRYLENHGIAEDRNLAIIHPGAGAPVKLWRPELLATCVSWLLATRPTPTVWLLPIMPLACHKIVLPQ